MTYRVGNHHGVTIVREGDGARCGRPDHDCARGHLVGVMLTAEDAALVVEALNKREAEDGRKVERAKTMFGEWADVRRRIVNRAEHRPSSLGDGLGYGPCVGCGELWPCAASRSERPDAPARDTGR